MFTFFIWKIIPLNIVAYFIIALNTGKFNIHGRVNFVDDKHSILPGEMPRRYSKSG
jgi:hypothetical protein